MHNDSPRLKLKDLQADYPGVFDGAHYVDVGIGWLPLIRQFVAEAQRHDHSLSVHELKEKWGKLRIWCDTDVLEARLAKAKAECKSAYTCEVCGDEGYVRRPPPGGGWAWWRCRCHTHSSLAQKSWPPPQPRPMTGMMQVHGAWYRYDRASDEMVPSDPPEGWSR
jgi:hypothetical protein